jgi:hypothetical protein
MIFSPFLQVCEWIYTNSNLHVNWTAEGPTVASEGILQIFLWFDEIVC